MFVVVGRRQRVGGRRRRPDELHRTRGRRRHAAVLAAARSPKTRAVVLRLDELPDARRAVVRIVSGLVGLLAAVERAFLVVHEDAEVSQLGPELVGLVKVAAPLRADALIQQRVDRRDVVSQTTPVVLSSIPVAAVVGVVGSSRDAPGGPELEAVRQLLVVDQKTAAARRRDAVELRTDRVRGRIVANPLRGAPRREARGELRLVGGRQHHTRRVVLVSCVVALRLVLTTRRRARRADLVRALPVVDEDVVLLERLAERVRAVEVAFELGPEPLE
mmetsp:Transcript_4253/g.12802  ORF Transcript_4253/g.12802 Transcript_4253/m.12802 type:complete len:275 (-) Transcript_4253:952-1776(-)